MSKNNILEFRINSSPHLTMGEITKRLFNRNFHSDVQFCVDNKIIYAHSLELMKRSVVFEQQLEGIMGDNKLIPITDFKYETFLEFIRFIYTDECDINVDNGIEILKLATKYKVISLENRALNCSDSIQWILKCFEHCVRDKYKFAYNLLHDLLCSNFKLCLEDKQFLLLHPDAVDEILKFDHVHEGVTEMQIFTALAKWITSYCEMHQILLSDGRKQFAKQIKRIRFPTMSIAEIRGCTKKYPGLLSELDCMSIGRQTVFGARGSKTNLWISKSREEFSPYLKIEDTFKPSTKFKTTFSVSEDTILYGLVIGTEERKTPIQIEIAEFDGKAYQYLKFVQSARYYWDELVIGLGDSLRLKKNLHYTIMVKYLKVDGDLNVFSRLIQKFPNINDPDQTVNIIEASPNMLEMFFKRPTD